MSEGAFTFTVDTHLFRELGELLVGRDSTALVELVKNAYDADATRVVVRAEDLATGAGSITITDDGVGMNAEVFRSAFLRIAGRYKEHGERRSPLYNRRYTGAKGVGRLSAQKLAHHFRIESWPNPDVYGTGRQAGAADRRDDGIDARIDWRRLEQYETLDSVGDALNVRVIPSRNHPSGTVLHLQQVRRAWTAREVTEFVNEVVSSRPPRMLLEKPSRDLVPAGSLFGDLTPWTIGNNDPGFEVVYEGDIQIGDELWLRLAQRTNWLVEIDATRVGVVYSIQPTSTHLERSPNARAYQFRRDHPRPSEGPFFRARIFAREYGLGSRASELAKFGRTNRGIRVYLEGFRVLPYGDMNDDWLGIDRDYARKQHEELDIQLDKRSASLLAPVPDEAYSLLGNQQYTGAVFLTADGASSLRPVVNREGFIEDASLQTLRELVRNGADLLTRVRASARQEAKSAEQVDRRENLEKDLAGSGRQVSHVSQRGDARSSRRTNLNDDISVPLDVARSEIQEIRAAGPAPADPAIDDRLRRVEAAVSLAATIADENEDERATLRVLAGVGLQFAGFVHEINGLLGLAQSVRTLVGAARKARSANERARVFSQLDAAVDQLVQALARQSSYLVDVVGPDARRRRRRIALSKTPEASLRLLGSSLSDRGIAVTQELASDIKTPPMFPAELTIIFTNLLTNAIKAAGQQGHIRIVGTSAADGGVVIRVENTGRAVDLNDSERWFSPFESTTTDVDVVLGQGMGLGLPITRRLLAEYGGQIGFVNPSPGYATAIEVYIPPREVGK